MPFKNKQINREYQKKWARKWRKENRDRHLQNRRDWYARNKEKNYGYYEKRKDKLKEYNNRPEIRERRRNYINKWVKEKLKNDPFFKINRRIGTAIYLALKHKKANKRWEGLVGYTLEDLIQRLEAQFDENMSWDNYGFYWHIDHIKPKSLFIYKDPNDKEFKMCWALSNLQPLEKTVNLIKGNRYEN